MKRKLLSLLLVLTLCAGMLAVPASAMENAKKEKEPNDTMWNAQSIELGQFYTGSPRAYLGDMDLFTFELTETTTIRVTMYSAGSNVELALFDGEGNQLRTTTPLGLDTNGLMLYVVFPVELSAGTYYVGLRAIDGTSAGYYFAVINGTFPCGGRHLSYPCVTTPATCTSEGVLTSYCLCGAAVTETIPADAGAHTWETEIVTPYTCTENGLARNTCTGCGAVEEQTLPAKHTAPGRIVIQEPTMEKSGLYYYTCTDCGYVDKYESRLHPLSHMFIDVKPGSFSEPAVCWSVYKGITNGTDNYHFSPDGDCTRSQAVTFLWRAAGSPEPENTEHPFTDVNENAFYYKAMLWAVEKGITNGTSDTTFEPESVCNRGQVVTFLYRAMGKPEVKNTEHPFGDVNEEAFYYTAMLWAVENGITKGTGDTTFEPGSNCNRGQVVTFLYRTYS